MDKLYAQQWEPTVRYIQFTQIPYNGDIVISVMIHNINQWPETFLVRIFIAITYN